MSWKHLMIRFGVAAIALAVVIAAVTFWPRVDSQASSKSERQVAYISSRIDGRVDRLFVDFTGVAVKQRDHLVEIYSPELLVAQNELLLSLDAIENAKRTS